MDWIQISILIVLVFCGYQLKKLYEILSDWQNDWKRLNNIQDPILIDFSKVEKNSKGSPEELNKFFK